MSIMNDKIVYNRINIMFSTNANFSNVKKIYFNISFSITKVAKPFNLSYEYD